MKACVLHGAKDLRMEDWDLRPLAEDKVRVRIQYVGLCGSDLHYWAYGKGTFSVVSEPLIMGHEASGTIAGVGAAVSDSFITGMPVAVNPATICHRCEPCLSGRPELCQNVLYLGSAGTIPHVQGALCEYLDVPPSQIVGLPEGVDLRLGALAEPLSVALHSVRLAGSVFGKSVLVTGAGPIGLLASACLLAAGAARVDISDVRQQSLDLADELDLGVTHNVSTPQGLQELAKLDSSFDLAIEASGASAGTSTALASVKPAGSVVQVGMLPAGPSSVRTDLIIQKQLTYQGSLRFGLEFHDAVNTLQRSKSLQQIVTSIVPLADTAEALHAMTAPDHCGKTLVEIGE